MPMRRAALTRGPGVLPCGRCSPAWIRFAPFLLRGVTGSGKTEVYLRVVAEVLQRGRQALLLVPEINLTPQLLDRFRMRFPDVPLVALHSNLAEGERLRAWRAAQSRSALEW